MILITGAAGTIGRELVKELRAARIPVRAMTRNPAKARAALGEELELVRGDFTDSRSLASALPNVRALFLLTAAGPWVADHDAAMLRAVKGTSVQKIVKMSAFGAGTAPLASSRWHEPGERGVMESGLAWTVLRPAGFASNAQAWVPAIRAGDAIELATGDGRHAVVDPRDVAAVAARALATDTHDGSIYELTGPEPLTAAEQIATLGRALGRSIATRDVTPEMAADRMREAGTPAAFADAVREGYAYVRAGNAASQSDAVERILGRAPRSFEVWVRDHLPLLR
ncbi:NAD(P)H-binding protein [Pendulispora albinea]|uniref:NAD(P)H-binding protein n=1 Tax=Pendulispora albinea TaxID=2741071 RepID=A0ABZ2LWP4_9BACT